MSSSRGLEMNWSRDGRSAAAGPLSVAMWKSGALHFGVYLRYAIPFCRQLQHRSSSNTDVA